MSGDTPIVRVSSHYPRAQSGTPPKSIGAPILDLDPSYLLMSSLDPLLLYLLIELIVKKGWEERVDLLLINEFHDKFDASGVLEGITDLLKVDELLISVEIGVTVYELEDIGLITEVKVSDQVPTATYMWVPLIFQGVPH